MVLRSLTLALTLGLWFQGSGTPPASSGSECLTAVEKQRLSREEKIDNRIKIYREVSVRFHKALETAVGKKSFDEVDSLLACWKDLLKVSLKDIEDNVNRKKKSGALIDYEIEVRKSIVDVGDARLKAPFQQQDSFDSWLTQANVAHEKFVDILFQR